MTRFHEQEAEMVLTPRVAALPGTIVPLALIAAASEAVGIALLVGRRRRWDAVRLVAATGGAQALEG